MCGKFETQYWLDENEYGFFAVPDAYCPECFALLDQIINHNNKDKNANGIC